MSEPVTVKLIDREFLIACEPEEKPGLIAAAGYLDNAMRNLRANAKSPGFDRLAVLAALSITHELLEMRTRGEHQDHRVGDRLEAMCRKLERAVEAGQG
ncbi:cell division protein ZapA [Oleiagrimonas sp. C23AA]|uniref:cell division protein ZapA n=1 Tax=Oleiagrimonas sp. C23AA TaxID=2719047 RepID=UPI0014202712|nr:cell division protein ZapA [Oleiagrimonas sp. C23AA]NII09773.1 cell division protein ZapA [Oleiagrimonas sp. C23AA]